ncbi:MAG: PH domain-containing protein [Planctomycetaceae bacterium]
MSVQAIAGVSSSTESNVMTVYPSVCANAFGRLLGQLYGCIPIRIFGHKLSTLLFALPTAPIGAPLYLLTKVLGSRYVLTNRSVQIWASLGAQKLRQVDLSEVDSVELEQRAGQEFFRAADVRLKSASGQTLLLLPGVGDAGAFRNAIQRTTEARRMVKSSLSTINARQ